MTRKLSERFWEEEYSGQYCDGDFPNVVAALDDATFGVFIDMCNNYQRDIDELTRYYIVRGMLQDAEDPSCDRTLKAWAAIIKTQKSEYKESGSYRGARWQHIAASMVKRVLQMEGYCHLCGAVETEKIKLLVHHMVPFRYFRNEDLANQRENLLVVCTRCHGELESLQRSLASALEASDRSKTKIKRVLNDLYRAANDYIDSEYGGWTNYQI